MSIINNLSNEHKTDSESLNVAFRVGNPEPISIQNRIPIIFYSNSIQKLHLIMVNWASSYVRADRIAASATTGHMFYHLPIILGHHPRRHSEA